MELTKRNLKKWKAEANRLMKEQHDIDDWVEGALSDKELLEDYLGFTPQDAIDGEVECWEPDDSEEAGS